MSKKPKETHAQFRARMAELDKRLMAPIQVNHLEFCHIAYGLQVTADREPIPRIKRDIERLHKRLMKTKGL